MMTPRPDHFTYPGKRSSLSDVRGGEIILKRPWQRAVFISGLVGAVLLALFVSLAA